MILAPLPYSPAFLRPAAYLRGRSAGSGGSRRGPNLRPGETIEAWTTLFLLHAYTADHRAPKEAAVALALLAGQRDQSAAARVMENAAKNEAMVTFMTSSENPSDDTVEVTACGCGLGAGTTACQADF